MMKTIDDEELVELEIEGGSCWIPDLIGAIDQVLWSNFAGSDAAKFFERFC